MRHPGEVSARSRDLSDLGRRLVYAGLALADLQSPRTRNASKSTRGEIGTVTEAIAARGGREARVQCQGRDEQ